MIRYQVWKHVEKEIDGITLFYFYDAPVGDVVYKTIGAALYQLSHDERTCACPDIKYFYIKEIECNEN